MSSLIVLTSPEWMELIISNIIHCKSKGDCTLLTQNSESGGHFLFILSNKFHRELKSRESLTARHQINIKLVPKYGFSFYGKMRFLFFFLHFSFVLFPPFSFPGYQCIEATFLSFYFAWFFLISAGHFSVPFPRPPLLVYPFFL